MIKPDESVEISKQKGIPKYLKEIIVVILLVFGLWLWPIGIYLTYRWKLWPIWVRIFLIILLSILTLFILERSAWLVRWETVDTDTLN